MRMLNKEAERKKEGKAKSLQEQLAIDARRHAEKLHNRQERRRQIMKRPEKGLSGTKGAITPDELINELAKSYAPLSQAQMLEQLAMQQAPWQQTPYDPNAGWPNTAMPTQATPVNVSADADFQALKAQVAVLAADAGSLSDELESERELRRALEKRVDALASMLEAAMRMLATQVGGEEKTPQARLSGETKADVQRRIVKALEQRVEVLGGAP